MGMGFAVPGLELRFLLHVALERGLTPPAPVAQAAWPTAVGARSALQTFTLVAAPAFGPARLLHGRAGRGHAPCVSVALAAGPTAYGALLLSRGRAGSESR